MLANRARTQEDLKFAKAPTEEVVGNMGPRAENSALAWPQIGTKSWKAAVTLGRI